MARKVDQLGVTIYVEKRRKTTGGYGATPRLPATIEDTFAVVTIASDLASLAPATPLHHPPREDGELRHYLQEALRRGWPGLRTTWQLLHTGQHLGLEVDHERAREYIHRCRAAGDDLYTAYYTARIAAELGPPATSHQGPGPTALPANLTVAEARMYLELQKITGNNPTAQAGELIAWLQRCQNGDGGFGFFPTTTSFIENCHHALAALQLLGARPAAPELARQFILSCQTGAGGFGRNHRAAPFLDATWHALAALRLLDAGPPPLGRDPGPGFSQKLSLGGS